MRSLLMNVCKIKVANCHINFIYNRGFSSLQKLSSSWENDADQRNFRRNFLKCVTNSNRQLHLISPQHQSLFQNKSTLMLSSHQVRHASILENYVHFMTNNAVVKGCENCLLKLHDVTGLPWWASIILTAFLVNATIRLPIIIYALKQGIKVRQVYEELKEVSPQLSREAMSYARRNSFSPAEREKYMYEKFNEKRRELFINANCHPRKANVAELSTLPVLLGISIGYRNLSGSRLGYLNADSNMRSSELTTEGILWFQNLAIPDPYFILPILLGVQSLSTFLIISLERQEKLARFQKILNYILTGSSVLFMLIASICPACMCLFWLSSGFFGNILRMSCKLPRVRRVFKVEKLPDETATPIKDLVKSFKDKYMYRY